MELFRYKLAAITTFTEELAQRATPAIEGILREALREAYAEVLDAALLSNAAAVQGVRPSGLLYDDFGAAAIAPLTPTAGGGEDAVRGDIMGLMAALTGKKLGARPVLLVNNLDALGVSMMTSALSEYLFRDEMQSGNLMGIPVISSANVPQHHVVLVDAAYLATAFDPPMFDVSNIATVVENSADTTPPTMVAVTASGAAGAAAGQVAPTEGVMVNTPTATAAAGSVARSLWQTYSIGIRMVAPTSWGVMQSGAVAHVTPTTWTA
jgi:HK97 family phage major capsid protein